MDLLAHDARVREETDGLTPAYLEALFEQQRAWLYATSKRDALLGPRRMGKSAALGADIYSTMCEFPSESSLAIAPTLGQCITAIGSPIERLRAEFDLKIDGPRYEASRMYYVHSDTGHQTWLTGCKDFFEAEKQRGDRLARVWIDECGAFPVRPDPDRDNKTLLHYLVQDAVGPRLIDLNGRMTLSGTPGFVRRGFWFDITTGLGLLPQWPVHSWSMFDNPYLDDPESVVEEMCRDFGLTRDSPGYKREVLGQWVDDPTKLIYHTTERNMVELGDWPGCIRRVEELFGRELHWVLGVDVGQRHETTFVLTVSARGGSTVLTVRTWGGAEMNTPLRAAAMNTCYDELSRAGYKLRIVMDPGGGGAIVAGDMSSTYKLPVEAALKPAKAAAIMAVQGALANGDLLINRMLCGSLLNECSALPWNKDRTNHDKNYPDDTADAWVYACRAHPRFAKIGEAGPPRPSHMQMGPEMRMDEHRRLDVRIARLEQKLRESNDPITRERLRETIQSVRAKKQRLAKFA